MRHACMALQDIELPVEPSTGWGWHSEPQQQTGGNAAVWSMAQAKVKQVNAEGMPEPLLRPQLSMGSCLCRVAMFSARASCVDGEALLTMAKICFHRLCRHSSIHGRPTRSMHGAWTSCCHSLAAVRTALAA